MIKKILNLNFIPQNADFALLSLRVGISGLLIVKHGWHKITDFATLKDHFPDPLHIGSTLSLLSAIAAENVFSVFLVLGIYARFAALGLFVNFAVIWALMYNYSLATDHDELVGLYLLAYAVLIFSGSGRYSLLRS